MRYSTLLTCILAINLVLSLLHSANAQTLVTQYTNSLKGDFVIIGNTFGYDAASGTPAPVAGTVGPTGTNTSDSAPDVFWRSDAPMNGQAIASTSITAANARTTAQLSLPSGAAVKKAYLIWASSSGAAGPYSAGLQVVGVSSYTLTSDSYTNGPNGSYQAVKDITSIVQTHGAVAYRVSDVSLPAIVDIDNGNAFAGWSMVVVYERDADAYRKVEIKIGLGQVMDGVAVSGEFTGLNVFSGLGGIGRLGIVAYEGDANTTGDSFLVNGNKKTNGLNPNSDFFNSTRSYLGAGVGNVGDLPRLTGTAGSMSGMDIDVVDIISDLSEGASSYNYSATSTGDAYLVGVLVSSVTVKDLVLTTVAQPGTVCAGSSVALSVTVTGGTAPYSYTWVAPPGVALSGTSTSAVSATATPVGVQTFTVTVALSDGTLTTTTTVSVTVSSVPTATLVASGPLAQLNVPVTLTAAPGASSYVFSPGAIQVDQGNTANVYSTGPYSVTLTGANGCSSSATTTVRLQTDLTPILYARPTTLNGNTTFSVVVDLVEINSLPTSETITVKVTKDAKANLTFPDNATSVGSRTVQNSAWIFSASDPNYYVLTTPQVITAGSVLSFGLNGVFNSGSTSGSLTISSTISGGDEKLSNNIDSDKIEYFQQ